MLAMRGHSDSRKLSFVSNDRCGCKDGGAEARSTQEQPANQPNRRNVLFFCVTQFFVPISSAPSAAMAAGPVPVDVPGQDSDDTADVTEARTRVLQDPDLMCLLVLAVAEDRIAAVAQLATVSKLFAAEAQVRWIRAIGALRAYLL